MAPYRSLHPQLALLTDGFHRELFGPSGMLWWAACFCTSLINLGMALDGARHPARMVGLFAPAVVVALCSCFPWTMSTAWSWLFLVISQQYLFMQLVALRAMLARPQQGSADSQDHFYIYLACLTLTATLPCIGLPLLTMWAKDAMISSVQEAIHARQNEPRQKLRVSVEQEGYDIVPGAEVPAEVPTVYIGRDKEDVLLHTNKEGLLVFSSKGAHAHTVTTNQATHQVTTVFLKVVTVDVDAETVLPVSEPLSLKVAVGEDLLVSYTPPGSDVRSVTRCVICARSCAGSFGAVACRRRKHRLFRDVAPVLRGLALFYLSLGLARVDLVLPIVLSFDAPLPLPPRCPNDTVTILHTLAQTTTHAQVHARRAKDKKDHTAQLPGVWTSFFSNMVSDQEVQLNKHCVQDFSSLIFWSPWQRCKGNETHAPGPRVSHGANREADTGEVADFIDSRLRTMLGKPDHRLWRHHPECAVDMVRISASLLISSVALALLGLSLLGVRFCLKLAHAVIAGMNQCLTLRQIGHAIATEEELYASFVFQLWQARQRLPTPPSDDPLPFVEFVRRRYLGPMLDEDERHFFHEHDYPKAVGEFKWYFDTLFESILIARVGVLRVLPVAATSAVLAVFICSSIFFASFQGHRESLVFFGTVNGAVLGAAMAMILHAGWRLTQSIRIGLALVKEQAAAAPEGHEDAANAKALAEFLEQHEEYLGVLRYFAQPSVSVGYVASLIGLLSPGIKDVLVHAASLVWGS